MCSHSGHISSSCRYRNYFLPNIAWHKFNIQHRPTDLINKAVCRRSDEALEFLATRTLVQKNAADAAASLNQNHCWDEWSYAALAGFLVSDILKKQALGAVFSKKAGVFIVPGNCTSVKCSLEVPRRNDHFSTLCIQRPCLQALLFNRVSLRITPPFSSNLHIFILAITASSLLRIKTQLGKLLEGLPPAPWWLFQHACMWLITLGVCTVCSAFHGNQVNLGAWITNTSFVTGQQMKGRENPT